MAGAVRTSAVGGSSSGTGNRTATITPAIGDLFVVYCCVAANTNDTPTCSDDNGGTYDLIDVMNFAIAADNYRMSVFIRTALLGNTNSTVVTVATGSNTSGTIHVLAMTGISKLGANAVRSKGKQDNQAAATAAPTLNQSALTANCTLAAQGSADTTTTPPTDWTEIQDSSQINDTVALATAFRASGFTGSTITFGAASSTQFCSHAMELDITAISASPSLSPSASDSPSLSPSASLSPSGSASPSSSASPSISPSASVSPSSSESPSLSPSASTSPSSSESPSISPSSSLSPSASDSPSISPSPSVSPSSSESPSVSPSSSTSPSSSESPSISPSGSVSPSSSESPSLSPSASESPSSSESPSTSPSNSPSPSASESPSLSPSASGSPSSSVSLSLSPSSSPSASVSPSPPPPQPNIIFADPGGDATQTIGHFNTLLPGVTGASYDPTQQVVGVGSYKFDSLTNPDQIQAVRAVGVLGATRRVSAYFWYDSLPDVTQTSTKFTGGIAVYSGGGFGTLSDFLVDDGVYATATPAQNSGQGAVFGSYQLAIPQDATIQSVKIIYERKYDVNTSIGISRVKWRVNGEEGPNHDNTDMPLTDTVVEVDVTGDRQWEPQHLTDLAFEVIAEARRGDSAVEHVQSWDYVKVEVVYQPAITIMAAYEVNDVSFSLALSPRGDHAVLRFSEGLNTATGTKFSYDGITKLLPNVKNRISFGYVGNGVDDLDIKVYVNGIEELSIEHSATQGWAGENVMDLYYGWVSTPGVSHVCRVDQIFIDDGDDLADCGNMLSTAKLPATVNDNNWNTTGGTGAVNERPLSETSFRQETRALAFAQNYTLQAASVGDVDISGETLAGYMPWAWVKRGSGTMEDSIALVANGVQVLDWTNLVLNTTPHLIKTGVVSSSYPSAAAGIGMVSNNETADTFMYECGVVVVYEGPPNPNVLFEYQQVNNETLPTIIDDNLAGVTSYEICWSVQEFDGTATMDVYIVESEGGSPQQVGTMGSSGGVGRMRIPIGIEVQVVVTVTGVTMMEIWRRINID